MTKLIVIFINLYQSFTKNSAAHCRYTPTCSQYAKEAFLTFGFHKGGSLTAKRLASCHPFSKRPIYDPV